MGKESVEIKRVSAVSKSPAILISKANLHKELTKQWSLHNGAVSLLQVIEDGYAFVLIKSSHSEIAVVCKGLANEGNRYTQLAKMLQEKGLIFKQERIKSFSIRRTFVWETVDPCKETFRSGDSLMLSLCKETAKIKKSIVKSGRLKMTIRVN